VVEEIDRGELSIGQAARLYGITGSSTIKRWLKQFGREHLIPNTVRIQMKDELRKLDEAHERIALLERALADSELERYVLKLKVQVLEEEHGSKKKSSSSSSDERAVTPTESTASKPSADTSA